MTDSQVASIFSLRSPNLVLAGDIGDPDEPQLHQLLSYVKQKYKRIIYVPGNHEFKMDQPNSNKTPQAVLNWFQRLDDQWDNFHFFYRRTAVYDGVRVVGATGWTTAPRNSEKAQFISQEGKKDRDFLEQTLGRAHEPTLVVTHYVPSLRLLQPSFKDSEGFLDYAQNLEMLCRPPVKTWVCGHIHQTHNLKIPYQSTTFGSGFINILCNPYGYPTEGNQPTTQITIA